MTVKIGDLNFDNSTYDEQGDVLYLHVGERQAAVDGEATRQGKHARTIPTDARTTPPRPV